MTPVTSGDAAGPGPLTAGTTRAPAPRWARTPANGRGATWSGRGPPGIGTMRQATRQSHRSGIRGALVPDGGTLACARAYAMSCEKTGAATCPPK